VAAWSHDELRRIDDSDELEIAAARRDGTLRANREGASACSQAFARVRRA
jgi:hypothetical protein